MYTCGVNGTPGSDGRRGLGSGGDGAAGKRGTDGSSARAVDLELDRHAPQVNGSQLSAGALRSFTLLSVAATGGHGGDGGAGGEGTTGSTGERGRGATRSHRGENGGPGGRGGDGGAGGEGGYAGAGANIRLAVRGEEDAPLLMSIAGIERSDNERLVQGGTGGRGGRGGNAGSGGNGGAGGSSKSWTTHSGSGDNRTTTRHHSAGGHRGPSGPRGHSGERGRDGRNGSSGVFEIIVGGSGVYKQRYDLALQQFDVGEDPLLRPEELYGLLEPGQVSSSMSLYAYLPMLTHLVCHHTLTYQFTASRTWSDRRALALYERERCQTRRRCDDDNAYRTRVRGDCHETRRAHVGNTADAA